MKYYFKNMELLSMVNNDSVHTGKAVYARRPRISPERRGRQRARPVVRVPHGSGDVSAER
jgi:hypothetical protein